MFPLPEAYYPILDATNSLVERQQWSLQRCRRGCDEAPRFVVFDKQRNPVLKDERYPERRTGFTLQEILNLLSQRPESDLATKATHLFSQLGRLERE